jgi:hypothetical protein
MERCLYKSFGIKGLRQEVKTTKQSVYYMNTNEPLNLVVLIALAGAGPDLGGPMSSMD